ncbi:MAG: hypothetical protein AB7E36_15090 [Salinivirgaceae bacterium]
MAKQLDTRVSIGKLRMGLNNNLIIRDFFIADKQNDTLFFADRIEARLNHFNLSDKSVSFHRILIKNSITNLTQLSDSSYNYSFVLEALKKEDSVKTNWQLSSKIIDVSQTSVNYSSQKQVINSSNIKLKLSNTSFDGSQIKFRLNQFSNYMNGQSFVRTTAFNFSKTENQIALSDFRLITLNSQVKFSNATLTLGGENTDFSVGALSTRIFLHEFYPLIPSLKNRREFLTLSGTLASDKQTLHGKDVRIQLGKTSIIHSNFIIHDFLLKEKLTYQFDIDELFTNADDINYIYNAYLNKPSLDLPEFVDNLGDINYHGQLTGNTLQIYSKGQLSSNLGKINSDIEVSTDSIFERIYLDGTLQAKPINLGALSKDQPFGKSSITLNTKGYYSKNLGPHFLLDGMVHHFEMNNQRVDSIKIKGNLDNEMFVGRVSSFDSKLRFDLDGVFDLDSLPSYDFNLILYNANLIALGLNKKDSVSSLSMNVQAKFIGNTLNNTTGDITVSELFYFKDTSYFATDSIIITSKIVPDGKIFNLSSEYVQLELQGNYNTLTLKRSVESMLEHYLPSLGIKPSKPDTENDFTFSVVANYPQPITEILFPDYSLASGSTLNGKFNALEKQLSLSFYCDHFRFFKREISDFNLKAFTKNNNLFLNIDSRELRYTQNSSLKNFMSSIKIHNDSINLNLNWNNWLEKTYSGNINTLVTILPGKMEQVPNLKFDIYPSNIIVIDTIWYISQGYIQKDSNRFIFENLNIDNGNSKLTANGTISKNPADSIVVNINNLSMSHLNVLLKKDNIKFNGTLSGLTTIKDLYGEKHIDSELSIHQLSLNGKIVGETRVSSAWNHNKHLLNVMLKANNGGVNNLSAEGIVIPSLKKIDLQVELNKQPFEILEPFLKPNLTNFTGTATGKARLYGILRNPKWDGKIFADQIGLKVASTNVDYYFSDSVTFKDRSIYLNNITLFDKEKNQGILTGTITHNRLETYEVRARIRTDKILGLKTNMALSPLFYGTVYGSGQVELSLINNVFSLDVAATTLNNSYFYIPLEGRSDIKDNDFIEFTTPVPIANQEANINKTPIKPNVKTNIQLDIQVTPEAEVQIIFDPEIGDVLTATGFAQLNIESLDGGFNMSGDYNINWGEFKFTLQNVIKKRLDIQPNSSVSWTGDPLDAVINLDAVYKIRKASVYDLTQDPNDKEKRVEVDCHLKMTDKLINPTIKFAVQVPSSTNVTAIDQLNSLPEDELNKQVLSLLLVNKFTPLYQQSSTSSNSRNLGSTTVSELLSNQLSNWLSQINSAFDLGFVYRPGDENTQQEYELALSTNLWNDRISVNGNVGYSNQLDATEKSPYTTDFQIEFKVNKKGNVRLRAFQKVNNDIEYTQAPYTQGFGIFYTEEFDTIDDLLQKIFRSQYATKPGDVEVKTENEGPSD